MVSVGYGNREGLSYAFLWSGIDLEITACPGGEMEA
jgi:hypothetical protein